MAGHRRRRAVCGACRVERAGSLRASPQRAASLAYCARAGGPRACRVLGNARSKQPSALGACFLVASGDPGRCVGTPGAHAVLVLAVRAVGIPSGAPSSTANKAAYRARHWHDIGRCCGGGRCCVVRLARPGRVLGWRRSVLRGRHFAAFDRACGRLCACGGAYCGCRVDGAAIPRLFRLSCVPSERTFATTACVW